MSLVEALFVDLDLIALLYALLERRGQSYSVKLLALPACGNGLCFDPGAIGRIDGEREAFVKVNFLAVDGEASLLDVLRLGIAKEVEGDLAVLFRYDLVADYRLAVLDDRASQVVCESRIGMVRRRKIEGQLAALLVKHRV